MLDDFVAVLVYLASTVKNMLPGIRIFSYNIVLIAQECIMYILPR